MADAGKALAKRFSEYSGREDQYDVRVVEGVDGRKQTQLIDKDTGSVSFAVDGTDFDPETVNFGGSVGGDPAISPKEAVEDNKVFRTSRGVLASPTQPEALEGSSEPTEIDNTDKSFGQENQVSSRTENQASTKTSDQVATRVNARQADGATDGSNN